MLKPATSVPGGTTHDLHVGVGLGSSVTPVTWTM